MYIAQADANKRSGSKMSRSASKPHTLSPRQRNEAGRSGSLKRTGGWTAGRVDGRSLSGLSAAAHLNLQRIQCKG